MKARYPESCRLPPFDHQKQGTEALVRRSDPASGRLHEGCFALFDEMGVGKTKQFIDAAQELYARGQITCVIVVTPAACRRGVWCDPELGELSKHLWNDVPNRVVEYHGKIREWTRGDVENGHLGWIVTNYEFLRSPERLETLLNLAGEKTLLGLDESSYIKSHKAIQTKACFKLRKKCGRVVIFNGTPIDNSPGDLYSQAAVMDPRILGCKNYYAFRARYAVLGGWQGRQIVGWRDLEDLQRRLSPYVMRRLKTDCLDLPEKLPPVTLSVTLDQATWKIYREMRDEMIAWLTDETVSVASQAGVRAMRLAQICSGFVGGIQDADGEPQSSLHVVGDEKLRFVLQWLDERLSEDHRFKVIIWCRFRAELERLHDAIPETWSRGKIWGGQSRDERQEALRLLSPETTPDAPVVVLGTPQAGSMGLNLTAADHVLHLSNDYRLATRLQSDDRVHRTGQRRPVWYGDVVATGPAGQRTIEHAIVLALHKKEDLAHWTTSAWIMALREE